jgi:hypothetical protein
LGWLIASSVERVVQFVDVASSAGLGDVFYCGNTKSSRYIIETLGSGVALLDYDRDGNLDAFVLTAGRLEGFPPGEEPTNHLYQNEGNGRFRKAMQDAAISLDNVLDVVDASIHHVVNQSGRPRNIDEPVHTGRVNMINEGSVSVSDYDGDGTIDIVEALCRRYAGPV